MLIYLCFYHTKREKISQILASPAAAGPAVDPAAMRGGSPLSPI